MWWTMMPAHISREVIQCERLAAPCSTQRTRLQSRHNLLTTISRTAPLPRSLHTSTKLYCFVLRNLLVLDCSEQSRSLRAHYAHNVQ